ncbi:MAG: hypothetical protein ACM3MF_08860 [Anaerolineae bacterium]
MSTKNSLLVIVAVAFLALVGMGAAKFVSPDAMRSFVKDDTENRILNPKALEVRERMAEHADALDGVPAQLSRTQAFALRDAMAQHADALAGDVITHGAWYGAIPQTSAIFNAAEALRLRNVVVEHSEALSR